MALIFLYKCCKFGEKICNNSIDSEFFLGDYFFWRALYTDSTKMWNMAFTQQAILYTMHQ